MDNEERFSHLNSEVFREAARHLSEVDERLKPVIIKLGVLDLKLNSDIFSSIIESILSQQLTPKAADSIINRFTALFPDHVLTAGKLTDLNEDSMRSCGISRQKMSYLRNLAEMITEGSLNLEGFEFMDDASIIQELVRIKGVGTWTAKMILIFSLGRKDILPFEDLGIVNAVRRVYSLDTKPGKAIIEKIAEYWHPYCSVASLYLWKLKDNVPMERGF